jgi:hypothetical protein
MEDREISILVIDDEPLAAKIIDGDPAGKRIFRPEHVIRERGPGLDE